MSSDRAAYNAPPISKSPEPPPPPPDYPRAMLDKFRFVVTDAAEAIVIHEALMVYRNGEKFGPTDVLRAEAADRILGLLDLAIGQLACIRDSEANVPADVG